MLVLKNIVKDYISGDTTVRALKGIDIKALSTAIGRKCGIVSVNEVGFAKALEKALIEGGFANDK